MAIQVKAFRACMTRATKVPHWEAVIDYSGQEVTILLPRRLPIGDTVAQEHREAIEAMECLAGALLAFSRQMRENEPWL